MQDALLRCIGGVVPPVCTPLTAAREVDLVSLRQLRSHLVSAGVAGLFALGSTGEAAYLTDEARRQVVQALSQPDVDDKDRVALLVGVVEPTANRVIDTIHRLDLGHADAIVVTGPFYANNSDAELIGHFEQIAAHSPVPLVAYNIPVNVGYALPPAVLRELLTRKIVCGIKDSSPDLGSLRRLVLSLDRTDDVLLFTGSDLLLDCALQVGATAAVAGLANVAPAVFVQALDAHRDHDAGALAKAQAVITGLTGLYEPTDGGSGLNSTQLGSIKTALRLLGVIAEDMLSAPMHRSSAERTEFVRTVLFECGLLPAAAA
jgi:4-hydroxy-tetrahydrodipicolinate synthase